MQPVNKTRDIAVRTIIFSTVWRVSESRSESLEFSGSTWKKIKMENEKTVQYFTQAMLGHRIIHSCGVRCRAKPTFCVLIGSSVLRTRDHQCIPSCFCSETSTTAPSIAHMESSILTPSLSSPYKWASFSSCSAVRKHNIACISI